MFEKIVLYLKMIKFSHSIFALPFAFTAGLMAASGIPSLKQIFWIVVAMVSARSGAMGLNRIIDIKIDAANPRTASRELPSGKIKTSNAALFTGISFAVFIFSRIHAQPPLLETFSSGYCCAFLYSYTKRFTWLSHIVLGIAISAAPVGAWIAVRGTFNAEILPVAFAVVFWLAGFDVLYALQDVEFDRSLGLYSIPAKFGVKDSLLFSRVFHLITWGMLAITGLIFGLGGILLDWHGCCRRAFHIRAFPCEAL